MKITSPSFANNGLIPRKFTCQGEDINPQLEIEGIPEETISLILVNDDPDCPGGTWIHWIVFDMPVTSKIKENTVPGIQGRNDFGRKDYGGPCTPSGTHRYFFRIYALDTKLNKPTGISVDQLQDAMNDHILDKAELIGLYKKS